MSETETTSDAVKRAIEMCHTAERTLQGEIGELRVALAVAEAKLSMTRNLIDELTRPAPKKRGPRPVPPEPVKHSPLEIYIEEPPPSEAA